MRGHIFNMVNSSLRLEPELREACEAVARDLTRRTGVTVGWTLVLRRAASFGLPFVQREAGGK